MANYLSKVKMDNGVVAQIRDTNAHTLISKLTTNLNSATEKLDALQIYVNVKDYGAVGDGVTNDYTAFVNALTASINDNKPLFIPSGVFYLGSILKIPTCDGLTIFGANNADSVIKGKIAVEENNILTNFNMHDVGFDGNGGDCFTSRGWLKYSEITNCHFKNWKNCLLLSYYVNVNISNCEFINASTGGSACITCGRKGSGSAGSNLTIENCLLNGNYSDDTDINCKVGVLILDCDAVWINNTDIGRFIDNCVKISPSFQSNNHHIESSYLDVTKTGHNLLITGKGTVDAVTITDTWFASASYVSKVGGCGIYCDNGNVGYLMVDSCRFYNIQGSGCYIVNNTFLGVLSNNLFHNIGLARSDGYMDGIYLSTPENVLANAVIKNNTFYNCLGKGTRFGNNTQGYVLNDNVALYCVNSTNNKFSDCKNNTPTTETIAVKSTLNLNLAHDFFIVEGNGTISSINGCPSGKEITLWFTGTVSFAGSNVNLAGNLTTTPNTVLRLVSVNNTWIEVCRSVK